MITLNKNKLIELPLLPSQRLFLDNSENMIQPDRYNIDLMLKITTKINLEYLKEALLEVINNHDILRSKFIKSDNNNWNQYCDESWKSIPFEIIDLSNLPENEIEIKIEEITEKKQIEDNFSFEYGNLIKFIWFQGKNKSINYFWIIAHHLLFDAVSLKVLFSDLFKSYLRIINKKVHYVYKSKNNFKNSINNIYKYIESKIYPDEKDYWLNQEWNEIKELKYDYPVSKTSNTISSIKEYTYIFNENETEKIINLSKTQNGLNLENLLLCSFSNIMLNKTNSKIIDIEVLNNARAYFKTIGIGNFLRNVGWFSMHRKIFFKKNNNEKSNYSNLINLSEQLNVIPNLGLGYYLIIASQVDLHFNEFVTNQKSSGLLFNFLGKVQDSNYPGFELTDINTGYFKNPDNIHNFILECNCMTANKNLVVKWKYSNNLFNEKSITEIANNYAQFLNDLCNKS